jgi:hypothetical protein
MGVSNLAARRRFRQRDEKTKNTPTKVEEQIYYSTEQTIKQAKIKARSSSRYLSQQGVIVDWIFRRPV